MAKIGSAKELAAHREALKQDRPEGQKIIAVCAGTGCNAYGSQKVVAAFKAELSKQGVTDVVLRPTGCHGFCERGTLVLFHPDGVLYQRVKAEDVPEIVEKTVKGGEYLEKHYYEMPVTGEKIKFEKDIPFYKHQNRLILGKNGHIDPTKIDDYIAEGGYGALAKALEMGGDAVLDEVKDRISQISSMRDRDDACNRHRPCRANSTAHTRSRRASSPARVRSPQTVR